MIFQKWSKYEPIDSEYVKYAESEPSVISAAHKIGDVYHAFANARHSFMCAGYENYGDLCGSDEISRTYIKTHFLLHALMEYAICLDLSWQVIWAYVQPASFEFLLNDGHKQMEKVCDRDNLHEQLDCAISQKNIKAEKLKQIMDDFDKDEDVNKLRTIYNSLKHRGIIHFEELGGNFKTMMSQAGEKKIRILSRTEYKIEEIENLLVTYHKKFQEYFNNLIEEIIPEDYLDRKVKFIDFLNVSLKMSRVQKDK